MMNTILCGDGDPTASRWPMGAGEEALLVRYHTGHGSVASQDQVQFEIAAAYRHYRGADVRDPDRRAPTRANGACSMHVRRR